MKWSGSTRICSELFNQCSVSSSSLKLKESRCLVQKMVTDRFHTLNHTLITTSDSPPLTSSPSGELLNSRPHADCVFAGGPEEYVLSYEPVVQQEGESETLKNICAQISSVYILFNIIYMKWWSFRTEFRDWSLKYWWYIRKQWMIIKHILFMKSFSNKHTLQYFKKTLKYIQNIFNHKLKTKENRNFFFYVYKYKK